LANHMHQIVIRLVLFGAFRFIHVRIIRSLERPNAGQKLTHRVDDRVQGTAVRLQTHHIPLWSSSCTGSGNSGDGRCTCLLGCFRGLILPDHLVHVPFQPRQQLRIAPNQLRAADVQRHQLLQRHQCLVVRVRPEVVVPRDPAVGLNRQFVHQRTQHTGKHEQCVLKCLVGRLEAIEMEQRHRIRVGHIRQLGQIVRRFPFVVQRDKPVVLLRPDRVVVDDKDHGQRIVDRVERKDQFGHFEGRSRAGARFQMLRVLEQRDEEGPILLPPIVQPAVALR
uniref:Uncharacterized protein n=1 Tax=Anopheles atroparvus TaxID=41427 RepID=A0A182JK77_ANOAO